MPVRGNDYPIKADSEIFEEVKMLAEALTDRIKANIESYLSTHPNEKLKDVEYQYNNGAWKLNITFKKK